MLGGTAGVGVEAGSDPELASLLASYPGVDVEVSDSVVAAHDHLQLRYRDKLARWRQEMEALESETGVQVGAARFFTGLVCRDERSTPLYIHLRSSPTNQLHSRPRPS